MHDPTAVRENGILRRLPDDVLARLLRDARVDAPVRTQVVTRQERHREVLFPLAGMVSMVTTDSMGGAVEAATIGREGMVGASSIFTAGANPFDVMWQLPGRAVAIDFDVVLAETRSHPELASLAAAYLASLLAQAGQNAGCNRLHDIGQRAAKWLLLTHDRAGGDTFELTQEFFAIMLGVTRPRLSPVASTFQRAGFIRYRRGRLDDPRSRRIGTHLL